FPARPTPVPSTLSLHDALPISSTGGGQPDSASARLALEEVGCDIAGFLVGQGDGRHGRAGQVGGGVANELQQHAGLVGQAPGYQDRKSTRLNSSHVKISYAVFC